MIVSSSSQQAPVSNETPGRLIFGAGAQGRVVAAVWRRAHPGGRFLFLDDHPPYNGQSVSGIEVCTRNEWLESNVRRAELMIALGDNRTRALLADELQMHFSFANVVDPSAVIMPDVRLGCGVFIGPRVVVQSGTVIEDHALLNTGAVVEHDSVVGRAATVSPGVCMAGRVHIEPEAFIGAGATLVGRVRIGSRAIVGAGAVVTRDVPPGMLAFGNPARVIRIAGDRDWQRLF